MTVDDTLEKLLADHLILIGRLSRILSLRSKDYWTMDDVGLYFNISARQAHRLTRDLPKGPLPGSRVHLVRKNDVLALAKQSIKRPVVESLLEQANKLLLTASDGQNPN